MVCSICIHECGLSVPQSVTSALVGYWCCITVTRFDFTTCLTRQSVPVVPDDFVQVVLCIIKGKAQAGLRAVDMHLQQHIHSDSVIDSAMTVTYTLFRPDETL